MKLLTAENVLYKMIIISLHNNNYNIIGFSISLLYFGSGKPDDIQIHYIGQMKTVA